MTRHTFTSDEPRHVVIGAGPLGIATAEAIAAAGTAVTLLSRSGAQPDGVPIPSVACDVLDPTALSAALSNVSVVYQCAQPAYTRWREEFEILQRAILRGAQRAGARVIIADNLYAYGAVDGPIGETTPMQPNSTKGAVRQRMTAEALDVFARDGLRLAIARGSDFFGPRVLGSALGDRVWEPMIAGRTARAAGNIDLPHTYTFIRDFGRAMQVLGATADGDGTVWHVPNVPAVSTRELLRLAEPLLGRPIKVAGTSRSMMRVAGLFVPEARESVEMMYEFEKPFIVSSARFTERFGVAATPLRDAVAETVQWFQVQHASRRAAR